MIRRTYKYRIYPTQSQISNLENQFSMCRYLYNWCLQERILAYQERKESIFRNQQQRNLPKLKKEKPWYKSVYSQVLQDVLGRLDKGMKDFFRRVKNNETPGFPNFKKRGEWNSITYPQYNKRPKQNQLDIPKVGLLKIVYHRQIPLDSKIKTLTIKKENNKWFVCFSVELQETPKTEHKLDRSKAVGIDLGLIDFLYASDGFHIEAPRFFRRYQEKLARLQRKRSKTEKYSKKWYKLLYAIQKVYFKIRCQRSDFLHKLANNLLEKYDIICHEHLMIKNMSRRPKPKQDEDGKYLPNGASAKSGLNKSINDAGWYQFLCILKYKAEYLGKLVIGVAPHYTSQVCPSCGNLVKKSLSVRTHVCPDCGLIENRDLVASKNILSLGMQTLASVDLSAAA
jgi:putative transposase